MQTNYLKYFVDIVDKGSIAAAAAADFISPQGMSRSLAVLESTLGCRLFERTQGKLTLTPFGRSVLPEARRILDLQQVMADKIAEVRTSEHQVSNKTVLAFLNNIAFETALFKPLVDSFDELFSCVRCYQCDNQEVLEKLIAWENEDNCVSLGLVCLFSPNETRNDQFLAAIEKEGFEYQPYLLSYDQVLVSKDSDLAGKKILSREDIASHPIVTAGGDIGWTLEALFGRQSIYMVTNDSTFRFHVVERNEAITFVPAFHNLVASTSDTTLTIPMKDQYILEVGFVARHEVFEDPIIKNFFAHLNSSFSPYADSPYMSFVPSEITACQMIEMEDEEFERKSMDFLIGTYGITKHEAQAAVLSLKGLSLSEVAKEIGASESAAKSSIHRAFTKTGSHGRNEFILLLEENGISRHTAD